MTAMLVPSPLIPFTLIQPVGPIVAPIIVSSPHSGQRLPLGEGPKMRVSRQSLARMEDRLVDRLFGSAPYQGLPLLCAEMSRTFIDLNRALSDLDPLMVSGPKTAFGADNPRILAGLGLIPRRNAEGQEIYTDLFTMDEIDRRIGGVHAPYHAALSNLLEAARARFGTALLLDCHSMPSQIISPGGIRPDIVLGDRFGASSAPVLMNAIETHFKAAGLKVLRNVPYAGGFITAQYGRPSDGLSAIQIEISRGLYLNETTLEPHDGFRSLAACLRGLLALLIRTMEPKLALAAE